ncbi:CRE-CKC-1 protein [Aphelenchoides avenae]|nr:CRE-CKC-1 protein [Aphelenchus avenae]
MPTVPAVTSLSVNLRLSVPCVANGHTLSHLPQTFSRYPSLRLSQFFTQCTVGLHRRRHIGAKRMKEYPQRRCSSPQQTFGTRSACGYIAMQWIRPPHYLKYFHEREPEDREVEQALRQIPFFEAAAHFFWSISALLKAQNSSIDFDYMEYAILRHTQYANIMESITGRD